jgi:DNA-binding NtrC family response regulator
VNKYRTTVEDKTELIGSGRILFVDDEVAIGKMATRMLETLGYEVVCLSAPREALRLYGEDPAGFDMVITDQTMPDMTGIELAEHLVALDSNVRIVLASGYKIGVPDETEMADYHIIAYLQKPFSMEEIGLILKDATQKRGAPWRDAPVNQ